MHIAIAGNIGVGKNYIMQDACKALQMVTSFEAVDNNPYLDNFYEDMQRWSFNLQVFSK